ncbi:MAG: hypothetical protein IJC50_08765 [Clostridia bacterium]|nr:hypothetical protein [Clostridia bacterium]
MRLKLFVLCVCLLLALLMSSCAGTETSDSADTSIESETELDTDTQSETESDTAETDFAYPAEAPLNSAVITICDYPKRYKVIDDESEIDRIINFFESLEKEEIQSDKKGGQTIAVVINTPEIKTRIYFINEDKIDFSGLYSVNESAYSDFLTYYNELPYPEYSVDLKENN